MDNLFTASVRVCTESVVVFFSRCEERKKGRKSCEEVFFLAKFPVAVVDVPLSGQERVEYSMS